ncbi:hypothetical protein F5Y08DRAFT_306189 [Xylaria arbuscula]|nr:hypothetical protein F5Y08DRAFT_306189 [Xylaria arbuscula]
MSCSVSREGPRCRRTTMLKSVLSRLSLSFLSMPRQAVGYHITTVCCTVRQSKRSRESQSLSKIPTAHPAKATWLRISGTHKPSLILLPSRLVTALVDYALR